MPSCRKEKGMSKFKCRLRQAMFMKEMTQEKLAEKLDINQCTISTWVRGLSEPRMGSIIALCEILDVSADWLLGLDEERK